MGKVFKFKVFLVNVLYFSSSFGLLAQPWNYSAYEDGTHQSGRYAVEGESQNSFIVQDHFTGLSWEQSNTAGNVFWSSTAARGSAQSYCSRLRKGNYSDWRVPSVTELQSLMDYTRINAPMTNQEIFSDQANPLYWASAARANLSRVAWVFDFKSGSSIYVLLKHPDVSVHCVRGESMQPSERYVDEQNGLITETTKQIKDRVTGLVWERTPKRVCNWEMAKQYCHNLALGEYQWHLPSIKALTTLVDYSRIRPSINSDVFLKTRLDSYLSSTIFKNTRLVWTASFMSGDLDTETKMENLPVRCVRTGDE
ncbi:MAG: DUF1566 domain-containing protein [Myxococcaceae bacterium]|nr:DUF1566 domain-containing protein [Myxococcaceae bacterium]MBH2006770.1 DUF1566 domain-containing protein [Myxococcaceae bacterium]